MTAAAPCPARELPELEPGQAIAVDWPADRYFSDTATTSRSELWMLRRDPPRYYATVIERSMPWETSESMDLGTLVHLAVLEPERFMATVRVKPEPQSKKTRTRADEFASARAFGVLKRPSAAQEHRSTYDALIASLDKFEVAGGRVLTPSKAALVTSIAHAVRSHEYASDLLALPGTNEQTIIWREETTGLLCRVRLDSLRFLPDAAVIVDLKTARDPEPDAFGRSIYKLGYDFQAGFYTDAVRALYPGREIIYAIIAVGTEPPFFEVSAAPLADRAIEAGRQKYLAALADLIERRTTNNWRASWENDRELVFDMPHWAYKKD